MKILDFGLARLKETTSEDATTPGHRGRPDSGTVGYMAPEQVLGQRADHRADIFAFVLGLKCWRDAAHSSVRPQRMG